MQFPNSKSTMHIIIHDISNIFPRSMWHRAEHSARLSENTGCRQFFSHFKIIKWKINYFEVPLEKKMARSEGLA